MDTKQFAVNWNNHMNHVRQAFDDFWSNSELTDVTLYADGRKIGAHRMLLSACSSYFRELFREFPQEHPIVVLKGVNYVVLTDILKFIYSGEVSVDSAVFERFLQTADYLKITGLTEREDIVDEGFQGLIGKQKKDDKKHKGRRRKRSSLNSLDSGYSKKIKEETNSINNGDEVCEQVHNEWNEQNDNFMENAVSSELVIKTEETDEAPPDKTASPEHPAEEDSPLKCPICSKVFSHPYSLHHHKPVHMGRTECPICHVVLSRKYNLKMHMKSRHNIV